MSDFPTVYSVVHHSPKDGYHIESFSTREGARFHLNSAVCQDCSRALFSPKKIILESYFIDDEWHDNIVNYFTEAVTLTQGEAEGEAEAVVEAQGEARSTRILDLNKQTRIEIEAATFRKLAGHLMKRSDVQNIDIMILAGFCRNCFYKWVISAAKESGVDWITLDDAKEYVYGMPFNEWKAKYQKPATAEQLAAFEIVMADPNMTTI